MSNAAIGVLDADGGIQKPAFPDRDADGGVWNTAIDIQVPDCGIRNAAIGIRNMECGTLDDRISVCDGRNGGDGASPDIRFLLLNIPFRVSFAAGDPHDDRNGDTEEESVPRVIGCANRDR